MSEYSDQKTKELECLCRLADVKASDYLFEDCHKLQNQKIELMQKLKVQSLTKYNFPVTNYKLDTYEFFGKKFTYKYIRQNNKFHEKDLSDIFYPLTDFSYDKDDQIGNFTVNAQGSMNAIVCGLDYLFGGVQFKSENEKLYFETQISLNAIKENNGPLCLIIDSSISDTKIYTKEMLGQYDLLIFDTTCFYFDHPEMKRIFDLAIDLNLPLINIRSCIKLDSLGVEYASLGSVYAFNLECLPKYNNNKFKLYGASSINDFITKSLGIRGMLSSIDAFYPFYWDDEFLELNSKRINRINKNMPKVLSQLKNIFPGKDINSASHGLFATINDITAVDDLLVKISNIESILKGPVYNGSSFGFDFVSVEQFINYNEKEKMFLRVTSHDLDEKHSALALKMIGSLF